MPDIINLLPENIANQIAAGEVIQRPASAVKELLENAVDADATEIKLFVNDAGKALIKVVDNGKGMSETDARMCFERHATSKIKLIDDLFHIRTMGFRGEALASIAGVAQVELKTKKSGESVGTLIEIDNSIVRKQEQAAAPDGTSISMKNVFFNVPARRNFLKSNAAEMRHIVDEFTRVALSFPQIFFSMSSNGQDVFHLESGSLKTRVVQLMGNHYASKLVNVKEETDYLNIYGFVGKPETAKKTRGDQYFFVNNRFIKSPYLNHAITNAFKDMIPRENFPMYVLFIDLDPEHLDINVHPTKQEIKFEDEKIIYAFVKAAVKHALAQFSITPTLDFELDAKIQQSSAISQPFTEKDRIAVGNTRIYQAFTQKNQAHFIERSNLNYPDTGNAASAAAPDSREPFTPELSNQQERMEAPSRKPVGEKWFQFQKRFIVSENVNGLLVINQQHAHERVLYERYSKALKQQPLPTQKSLFPATFELSAADTALLIELLDELKLLGYIIEPFGKHTFIIQGTPSDFSLGNDVSMIEELLEEYKHYNQQPDFSKREKLLRSFACRHSIKQGYQMSEKEIKNLIDELFGCSVTNFTPDGKPVFVELKYTYLDEMFGK